MFFCCIRSEKREKCCFPQSLMISNSSWWFAFNRTFFKSFIYPFTSMVALSLSAFHFFLPFSSHFILSLALCLSLSCPSSPPRHSPFFRFIPPLSPVLADSLRRNIYVPTFPVQFELDMVLWNQIRAPNNHNSNVKWKTKPFYPFCLTTFNSSECILST